jgi:hypothetical protein
MSFLKPTKKLLYNIFSSKRAVFIVFLAVLVLGFSVKTSSAITLAEEQAAYTKKASELKKDGGGNEYVTIGVVNYYIKEQAGQKWVDFGGVNGLKVVGGNTFNDAVKEQVTKQANNGQLKLESTASGAVTVGDLVKEAKTDVANTAFGVLLAPVIAVLFAIVYFLKTFVSWSAMVLDFVLDPTFYNFTSNSMIVQGWNMVRDICNLFFLLVLLFIAICTILKIEKYHAKKTLLMLIIMALLINFSKPITIFIFDGSQLLMNEFLRQMGSIKSQGQTGSTMVTQATNISNMIYNSIPEYFNGTSTSADIFVSYLFATVFLFMLMVALLVTAIFLIIRIVVIMLLIIVSPLAFFAAIVPDFSKMSSSWWSALFEYSYYGPAAAFFLLLATKLSSVLPEITRVQNSGPASFNKLSTNIIHYIVVLVFLYASIFMAKKFGGGAGSAVTNWGNKALKGGWFRKGGWPREIAGWGARTTGAADVYKGVKQGIGKQPGWRILTKEGREAKSKERQEKWTGKVAPFSMADERKKAKEEEFKDQAKVDAGIAKGSAKDLLIGSKRGTLTPEQLEKNSKAQQLLASSPELRKEVLGNLRDKGQSHTAAFLRSLTPEKEDIEKEKTLEDFGKEEIYNNKKLGDMDWNKVINFKHNGEQPFEQILVNRLENIAKTNAQGFLNIASNLDGTKQDILRDNPKFKAVLQNARENTQNRNAGSQTGGYQSGGYGS